MNKSIKSYLLLIPISGSIIVLDQITKTLVRNNIPLGDIWSPWPWLVPYARIVHWSNTGVAFGLFQGQGLLLTFLAFIIAAAIFYFYPKFSEEDWPLRLALGMQFGGAVGNLIDRLTIGHVIDFISIGNFPVFNIADASITVGVGVMILGLWWKEKKEKEAHQSSIKTEKPVPGADSNLDQK